MALKQYRLWCDKCGKYVTAPASFTRDQAERTLRDHKRSHR